MKNEVVGIIAVLVFTGSAFAEQEAATLAATKAEVGLNSAYVGELASKVRLNGFLSQGYLLSSGNNFFATSKKHGTFEFNEVGLTVNADVTEKLHVGAQILSRDLGPVGNNEVRLDWAFGDYHASDYLGVRIGKVKLPLGLYNEGRDSDFLRPMVFLPQSIYDDNRRDLWVAYQGIGIYGNIPLAKAGDLDYKGFVGELNFQDDSTLVTSFKQASLKVLRKQYPSPPAANPAQISSFKVDNNYVFGGAAVYNTPLSGLRFGVSYMQGQTDLTIGSTSIPASSSSGPNGSTRMKHKLVYSAEYTHKNLLLAGEYSEAEREMVFLGSTLMSAPTQEYYLLASYTMFDKLSLNLLWDVYYENMHDKDGLQNVKQGLQDYLGWRKDYGAGLRYDVNDHWTLKAEYHYVDGCALLMQVVNPPPTLGSSVPALRRYWDYVAVKASFNF